MPKIEILRVKNGFVILPPRTDGPFPVHEGEMQVASTPGELADLVRDWADSPVERPGEKT